MVPLASARNIERFCQAGASELYFGFEHPEWNRYFGGFAELNRMSSFGSQANLPYAEVAETIKRIHEAKAAAFVTLNSPAYSERQLAFLKVIAQELEDMGADGLIVGSIEMCALLQKYCSLPLTASTMCAVYNTEILSFYRSLGIKRMILPRDLRWDDLCAIVTACPGIEFECFILRNGCRFSDANCLSFHSRKFGAVCCYIKKLPAQYHSSAQTDLEPETKREIYGNHFLYDRAFHASACGLCQVDAFREMGICSLKIVGRADNTDEVVQDIALLRRLIDSEGTCRNLVRNECLYGLNCYYPQP
ncbi:MAG: U32 family peptidase [bacterium]|nr:U32 family peptidase [bacterium]